MIRWSTCSSVAAVLVGACGSAAPRSTAKAAAEPVFPLTVQKYPTRQISGEVALLTGTVRDARTSEPLEAVTVVMRSDPRDITHPLTKGRATLTDEHGHYMFKDVEPGRNYDLFFWFGSLSVGTLAAATSGFETIVDARIDTSRLEGETVRVSTSGDQP